MTGVACGFRSAGVAGIVAAAVLAATLSAPRAAYAADDEPLPGWQSSGAQSSATPAGAVPGSTPERRQAWENLSEEQRTEMLTKFQEDVGARVRSDVEAHAETDAKPSPAAPSWEDVVSGKAAGVATQGPRPVFVERALGPESATAAAPGDGDADGLPESFENQVADAFTPFYHVSGGEAPGTGFALFADQVPLAIQQNLPPTPPVSHFRVKPLGFGTAADGSRLSVLRVDYLTLWNRDDGLDSGGACLATAGALFGLVGLTVGEVLQGVRDHQFDFERSAALVAAPVTGPTINLDPAAYKAYAYYTTAHEGEPLFDKSTFILPDQPVPAGTHIQLALARAKHGTYAFNPNGLPMLPAWLIVLVYDTINFLFLADIIGEVQYLIYSFIADSVFFGCVIERFEEQGGQFAQTRINVGEPEMPINQSGFINDVQTLGGLRNKLVDNLFFFFQPEQPPPPPGLAFRTAPAVERNGDGRLEAFAVGSDCAPYHAWQTSPGGSWSAWYNLGGCIAGGLAVARNTDGRLQIYGRGSDGSTPFHNWQTVPGGGWSGWHGLGGALTSDPVVHADGSGRLVVFARGTDCAIHYGAQTAPGQGWGGWQSLGGCVSGAPGVARNIDGRLEVYVRAGTTPYRNWQTSPGGGWSGWHGLDGAITTDPVVHADAFGRLVVFAQGTDCAIHHAAQTSPGQGWSGWHSLGGCVSGAPAVARNADGRLEVYVRAGTTPYRNWQTSPGGGWSGWHGLDGAIIVDPVVTVNADGRLEVFAPGTDDALHHAWQTSPGQGWSGWYRL